MRFEGLKHLRISPSIWRGAAIGFAVGLLGGGVWLLVQASALRRWRWFLIDRCPPPSVSPDCGFAMLAPIFFGPVAILALSVGIGVLVEATLARAGRDRSLYSRFAVATGTYALVAGALVLAAHVVPRSKETAWLLYPLVITGLDWMGPLVVAGWAALGGVLHSAARRG